MYNMPTKLTNFNKIMKIRKLSLAFATCILSVAANASSIDNTPTKKGYSY